VVQWYGLRRTTLATNLGMDAHGFLVACGRVAKTAEVVQHRAQLVVRARGVRAATAVQLDAQRQVPLKQRDRALVLARLADRGRVALQAGLEIDAALAGQLALQVERAFVVCERRAEIA